MWVGVREKEVNRKGKRERGKERNLGHGILGAFDLISKPSPTMIF